MSGIGGLTGSKNVMCLRGGVSLFENSTHDKTCVLGGGSDTACGSYIV